ncbi:6-pyruvoyl-tetrahydropterin synthase-related protein [Candidatus Gracilibacteria bacterium]|nr:6-pyruvoyl-tetrahydropterin synthase-related protein [Candidatus Gracilibacteria bacterium]
MTKKSILFLCFIAIIILYPLVIPGYIFSLDQAFPYIYSWPKFGANNYWLNIIGVGFSSLGIPTWILEKLTYIGVFGVIGFFGYKLTSRFRYDISKIFAILFLAINPFFYGRFVEGQINVYVSYAFFIMFFYFVIEFFAHTKYNYWKHISLTSLLLCLTSIHNIFIIALILLIFGGYFAYGEHKEKNFWKYSGFLGASLIVLNSFWIIPTMLRDDLTSQIASFGDNHRSVFASSGGIVDSVYLNILSLKGYWGEAQNRFISSELLNEYYFFIFLVIFGLVLLGVIHLIRYTKNYSLGLSLISLAILSFVLGLGISENNIFTSVNTFLFENIPFYAGFREPHKWILVVTIIYAYFGAQAIDTLYHKIDSQKSLTFLKNSFILLIISLPLVYSPAMFLGAWGQLHPTQYPSEWTDLKSQLIKNPDESCDTSVYTKCYNPLVFPWHGYMQVGWTRKPIVIAGIMRYFGPDVLFGDTIEIGSVYTQSLRLESRVIEKYIGPNGIFGDINEITGGDMQNFVTDIQQLGIQNIILLKEADYTRYQDILELLLENKFINIQIENGFGIVYNISQ